MARVNEFILNTDYASLTNDAVATPVVRIPAGTVIAADATGVFSQNLTLGKAAGLLNVKISNNLTGPDGATFGSSADAGKWFIAGVQLAYTRTTTIAGNTAYYTVYVMVSHSSGNIVQCDAVVPNPYSYDFTIASDDVYSLGVRTYLTPLSIDL